MNVALCKNNQQLSWANLVNPHAKFKNTNFRMPYQIVTNSCLHAAVRKIKICS